MATIHPHPAVMHSEASMEAFQLRHGLLILPPPAGSNHALAIIPAANMPPVAGVGGEAA